MAFPRAYYVDSTVTALTTAFQLFNFADPATRILIENESSTSAIFWSLDGTTVAGKITTESAVELQGLLGMGTDADDAPTGIYLKGAAGSEAYNLSAW